MTNHRCSEMAGGHNDFLIKISRNAENEWVLIMVSNREEEKTHYGMAIWVNFCPFCGASLDLD